MLAGDLAAVAEIAMREGATASRGSRCRRSSRSARCSRRPRATCPPASSGSRTRTSSGSSTARGSRPTAWATRSRSSRATSPTSPSAYRRSWPRCEASTRRPSSSTARRSRCATTGGREPFQVTMSRFGTRAVTPETTPLSSFFFDCLHVDGEDLIDRPAHERLADARRSGAPEHVVPRLETSDRRRPRRSSTTRSCGATRA